MTRDAERITSRRRSFLPTFSPLVARLGRVSGPLLCPDETYQQPACKRLLARQGARFRGQTLRRSISATRRRVSSPTGPFLSIWHILAQFGTALIAELRSLELLGVSLRRILRNGFSARCWYPESRFWNWKKLSKRSARWITAEESSWIRGNMKSNGKSSVRLEPKAVVTDP